MPQSHLHQDTLSAKKNKALKRKTFEIRLNKDVFVYLPYKWILISLSKVIRPSKVKYYGIST